MSEFIAVKGGTLIDCTGAPPLREVVVLVQGSRIMDVGTAKDVDIPKGAEVIDAKGRTVMPGLMDLHVHVFQAIGEANPLQRFMVPHSMNIMYAVKHLREMLEAGFTTARDLVYPFADYSGRDMVVVKTAIERGMVRGSRLVTAGVVAPTAGHLDVIRPIFLRTPEMTADGVHEVRKQTRLCLREAVDWIKTTTTGGMAGSMLNQPGYPNYTVEELRVIVEEAHAVGARVASHSEGIIGCRNAAEAGIDTLEHATELDEGVIEQILRKDLSITLTDGLHIYEEEVLHRKSAYLPKKLGGRPFEEVGIESHRKAYEAGVNIAMGTDCGPILPPGRNAYELEANVRQLGMSPMDAILTATRNAAKALGRLDELGTLEKGKIADLLVVDGDPLRDIRVLQDHGRIKVVMKDGRVEVDRRP